MTPIFPQRILAKFNLANTRFTSVPYHYSLKNTQKTGLWLHLLKRWREQQKANRGNDKWATYHKYIHRFFAKQVFKYKSDKTLPNLLIAYGINRQFLKELGKLRQNLVPISKQGFEQFLTQAKTVIQQSYHQNKASYLQANRQLAKFVAYQNKFIIQEYHYHISASPIDTTPKENPLSIDNDYVSNGKKLKKLHKAVLYHWQTTSNFSQDECIGWLIFSGILYGGINYFSLLQAWLNMLINASIDTEKFIVFNDYRLLLNVRYASDRYGNEFENENLFNTQQILLDSMSMCWLYRLLQFEIKRRQSIDIKKALMQTLQPIFKQLGMADVSLNWFFKAARYHWELLDGVDIDHALVLVMQGRHATTGLIEADFHEYLTHYPQTNTATPPYDLPALSQLNIEANTNPSSKVKTYKEKVRRSDLIDNIRQIFDTVMDKKYRPQFIKALNKKPSKNEFILHRLNNLILKDSSLSEKILIGWIIHLVERQTANYQSILQYITTIGYEWLYFTNFMPIENWTEEDFSETYEELLDFKKHILGNQDIGYSARRLQSLHRYAEENFGLVQVRIEQAESRRKVRAKLISPQLYTAFLEQLNTHTIGLDSRMLAVFFILSYRTGLRKQELLGLKFHDIELLSLPTPSLIIRPNEHRSIKTEGSIRRLPSFAVLTQQELHFVSDFLRLTKPDKLNQLVFISADSLQAIADNLPLALMQKILVEIDANDDATLHTFRHSTATNLALTLNANEKLVTILTQLDCQQIQDIKQGLLGVADAQDKWYALANFMGHISPERTFAYYIHTATLMATDKITQANISLPLQIFQNITGFDKRKLRENDYTFTDKNVSLKTLRPLLNRLILDKRKAVENNWQSSVQTNKDVVTIFVNELTPQNIGENIAENAFMLYSVSQVLSLLKQADKLFQEDLDADFHSIIANSLIDDITATHLLERAKKIASLSTRKGRPRFVATTNKLMPIELQYDDEKKLCQTLMLNLRKLMQKKDNSYQYLLELGIKRLSTRQASLPLTTEELRKILPIAITLLPLDKWLIKHQTQDNDIAQILRDFESANKLATHNVKSPKFKTREGRVFSDCEIGIIHTHTFGNENISQFSSLLRFIVHYLYLFSIK